MADLCKQEHVPVMRGDEPLFLRVFLITTVHQSPVGPGTYRKEWKAPADEKAGRIQEF